GAGPAPALARAMDSVSAPNNAKQPPSQIPALSRSLNSRNPNAAAKIGVILDSKVALVTVVRSSAAAQSPTSAPKNTPASNSQPIWRVVPARSVPDNVAHTARIGSARA